MPTLEDIERAAETLAQLRREASAGDWWQYTNKNYEENGPYWRIVRDGSDAIIGAFDEAGDAQLAVYARNTPIDSYLRLLIRRLHLLEGAFKNIDAALRKFDCGLSYDILEAIDYVEYVMDKGLDDEDLSTQDAGGSGGAGAER